MKNPTEAGLAIFFLVLSFAGVCLAEDWPMHGRNPEHMASRPACLVMLGETRDEGQKKRDLLDSKVNYANAIASLSIALGHDARHLGREVGPREHNVSGGEGEGSLRSAREPSHGLPGGLPIRGDL